MQQRTLDDFMSKAQVEALTKSTAVAQGLPGAAYIDPDFWELERQRYFPSRWMACAYVGDVSESRDAIPVSIAGFELLLTRDEQGKLHAFHNVCSHRAMRVLDAKQTGDTKLRCPWHCWTYDLCGQLVATPNIGGIHVGEEEAFDRSQLGLREVRCGTFLNLVFVNLDSQAPSLETFLAPLKARLAAYDLDALRVSEQTTDAVFNGNWKLVMEGGLEDYHLPWVHPQLGPHAGTFSPELDESGCYVGISNRRPYLWQGQSAGGNPREIGNGLRQFPHLAPDHRTDGLSHEGIILMVPPSAVIAVMSDHVVTSLLSPMSLDRTAQRRTFLYLGDTATSKGLNATREAIARGWATVGEQDLDLVETMQHQQSLREQVDMPTRFSPHWEPAVHHFQKMIVEQIRASTS